MAPNKRTPAGGLVWAGLADMAAACRRARARIDIATPFLSNDVAGCLVREADAGSARERRFLTATNTASVEGGYLDVAGVEEFLAADFEVRSLRNLHAKLLLTDGTWGLVGSGNLTVAGANGGNAELGVVLDAGQAAQAQKGYFERWWKAAEPVDLRWLRTLRRRAPAASARKRTQGRGGLIRLPAPAHLGGFASNKRDSGYWLKILYGSSERMTATHWRRRMWVGDRHRLRDRDAVMRVTEAPVFDPALVAREAGEEDAQKWAWVTWVEPVAALSLSDAPTLSDIGVASSAVRQHGHIRLSRQQYRRALHAVRGW
jgi:phosphatidylserine/phosphatidylglycerophosphate/cardiolipin synthase-like enzyme